jgi:hypothetical protein
LAGETIYVGCEVAGLRSVDADGIATHIVGGDDEHVEALSGGVGGCGDSDENGGEQDEATGKEGGHGWGGERGDGERERGGEGERERRGEGERGRLGEAGFGVYGFTRRTG